LWTRHEAHWKACGLGLAGVEQEAVSTPPVGWSVRDLAIGPGYAAAVCAAGLGWALRCERFTEDE
jgi:hypothetical protein